jgi:hypothetical protein
MRTLPVAAVGSAASIQAAPAAGGTSRSVHWPCSQAQAVVSDAHAPAAPWFWLTRL